MVPSQSDEDGTAEAQSTPRTDYAQIVDKYFSRPNFASSALNSSQFARIAQIFRESKPSDSGIPPAKYVLSLSKERKACPERRRMGR